MPPSIRADQAVARVFADNFDQLTLGENLRTRTQCDDIKGLQVACILDGGLTPDVCHNGTPNPTTYKPLVQVLIRSDVGCYDEGLDLTREMIEAVHLSAPPTDATDTSDPMFGFMDARVAESQPNSLGEINDGQHEWSFNIDLEYEG